VHHGPTLSFHYKDPNGNRLELQVDMLLVRPDGRERRSPRRTASDREKDEIAELRT